ncbi:MAG: DUF2550 domain-containing protein [Kineosporiaceae bacterium]
MTAALAAREPAIGDGAARAVGLVAALVVLAAILLLVVLIRRWALVSSPGAFECRVRPGGPGTAWRAGVARYDAVRLSFFPLLSLSWWPALVLVRHRLSVVDRRRGGGEPGAEGLVVAAGTTVLRCRYEDRVIEIAMDDRMAGGFAVWVESGPPGRGISVA